MRDCSRGKETNTTGINRGATGPAAEAGARRRDRRTQERLRFALQAATGRHTLEGLAARLGRSRSTIQNWLDKFHAGGWRDCWNGTRRPELSARLPGRRFRPSCEMGCRPVVGRRLPRSPTGSKNGMASNATASPFSIGWRNVGADNFWILGKSHDIALLARGGRALLARDNLIIWLSARPICRLIVVNINQRLPPVDYLLRETNRVHRDKIQNVSQRCGPVVRSAVHNCPGYDGRTATGASDRAGTGHPSRKLGDQQPMGGGAAIAGQTYRRSDGGFRRRPSPNRSGSRNVGQLANDAGPVWGGAGHLGKVSCRAAQRPGRPSFPRGRSLAWDWRNLSTAGAIHCGAGCQRSRGANRHFASR